MSTSKTKLVAKARLKLTIQECEDQLVRVRDAAASPECTPTDTAKLAHELRSLLKLRAHLEEREVFTRDRICDSEAWKQLATLIAGSIADCNACSAKLEVVLGKSKV